MNSIISFLIAFCIAITLANGIPESAGNCGCLNENKNKNENNDKIEGNLDEAKNIALNQELQANDIPGQGLLAWIFRHLGSYLKTALSGVLAAILSFVSNLPESVTSAIKGLSRNGLIGFLGGLARGLNVLFRKSYADADIGLSTGSDPEQNALMTSKVNEALKLSLANLNSGCKDEDGDLNDVFELIKFLGKYAIGLVTPYIATILGSAVNSLFGGLLAGLSKHGLLGGVLGTAGGLLHGLIVGTLEGFSDYVKRSTPK